MLLDEEVTPHQAFPLKQESSRPTFGYHPRHFNNNELRAAPRRQTRRPSFAMLRSVIHGGHIRRLTGRVSPAQRLARTLLRRHAPQASDPPGARPCKGAAPRHVSRHRLMDAADARPCPHRTLRVQQRRGQHMRSSEACLGPSRESARHWSPRRRTGVPGTARFLLGREHIGVARCGRRRGRRVKPPRHWHCRARTGPTAPVGCKVGTNATPRHP